MFLCQSSNNKCNTFYCMDIVIAWISSVNIDSCVFPGCQSSEGDVYKNNETWREGDCVTCHCVDGKKRCQAEMCVKTCLNPKPVPGRCCPICDGRSKMSI